MPTRLRHGKFARGALIRSHESKLKATDGQRRGLFHIVARNVRGQDASGANALKQRLGNQGMRRLMSKAGEQTSSPAIQAKLTVSSPGDVHEQEADWVASAVMRMPDSSVRETSVVSSASSGLQRMCTKCDDDLEKKSVAPVQRKEQTGEVPAVTSSVTANIQSMRGGGRELTASTRAFFEPRFGADFSSVRVHTDERANETAKSIGAKAFTHGRDIAFASGQYSPGSSEGQHLLAHELTHVVQQSGLRDPRSIQRQPASGTGGTMSSPSVVQYQRGESEASHREPGHLDPDVERLAPDKLLVADFGVDWRHVKGSTKADPTLRAWLNAWERDDTYRLSIVGYSDSVGGEELNTGLRQARASNIEALLGPSAKSRVTFRGMAGLGNYVTGNGTPAARARNRGVVIQFHQEFTFPPLTIEVKPQHCGPDSTQWLADQMNRNRDHPVIKTQRETQWPNWIPFFNLGWNYGALSDFRDLVKSGAPWDFKSNQKQWRSGGDKCTAVR